MRSVALTSLLLFACGSGGGFPDAKPKDDSADPPGGNFRVNWSLVDLMNATISCNDVSALSITGTMRNSAVAGGKVAVFACGAGSGQSEPIPPGTWDIDWELSGGIGTIATLPRIEDVVIESNKTTQLSPITFMVDTTGGLALHVTANKTGGNCGPTGSNGAGITGMTVTLVHPSGGACEPATLMIAAGATRPASSYTINCGAPMDAGCIENDQAITATGLPTGAYQIHIKGNVGATNCFTNDDQFSVPPAGKNLTRTLNLGPTGQPGC